MKSGFNHKMFKIERNKYPYRKSVLGIIVNNDKEFLIVQKLSYKDNEWSFAGGGIDENETPNRAVLRELKEELGSENFKIITESKIPYRYEWPENVILERFDKKGELFRGQKLTYFLIKFVGEKSELKIQESEIKAIKWTVLENLSQYLVFPDQWSTAKKVIDEIKQEIDRIVQTPS